MDTAADRKLFLGARLKRLRRDLSLTQTAMAADLGVSPSYLNHIERNQRPVSAQLLLRLAETYDVDLRTLNQGGEADEARLAEARLREAGSPVEASLAAAELFIHALRADAPALAAVLTRNREGMAPWEPVRQGACYTEAGQREILHRLAHDASVWSTPAVPTSYWGAKGPV